MTDKVRSHRILLPLILILSTAISASAQQKRPAYLAEGLSIDERVELVLKEMTLDEKIGVIHAQSKFSSPGVGRLGIPDFWMTDGPHGIRPDVLWDEWEQAGQSNDSCVAFPALTCLAASWDPSLSYLYGYSLGEEARYRGKDMLLGPGVNILRTPLNGRNFEYMGEDPYLVSRMTVPYIHGLQETGVAACVKHYALNNAEIHRHTENVIVSDRALHEIYLPAFKASVQEGGAWAIMGAYNLYKDQHNCHNRYLINDILKGDWGFDGVLVSDWGGTSDTDQAIHNGLDMEFGTWTDGLSGDAGKSYDSYHLANSFKQRILDGSVDESVLDEKVRRVLKLFFRTTLSPRRAQGFINSPEHYRAAHKIATEGIVLLKNAGNLLPLDLSKNPRILVVGENAIKMMTVGGGSSSLKVQQEISPLDGLRERLDGLATVDYARGYIGDPTGEYNGVTTGQDLSDSRSPEELRAEMLSKAKGADYVIFVGGLNKSDYQDAEGKDRRDYGLPYGQSELLEALAQVNPRIVFVNISGNPVAMPWIDRVPAVVQGWFLGSESGHALASILTGDVNPSGKLPYTWPVKLADVGAHALGSYPGTKRADSNIVDHEYKEGIYVGYRWADKEQIKPLFAFGHGLSYTSFAVSNIRASSDSLTPEGTITFTAMVENTGARPGAEVIQLYVHDKKASVDRPYKELKAFQKVELQPGERKTVSLTIDSTALSFYDEKSGQWVAEPGAFEALIGTASDHITAKVPFVLKN